MTRGGGFDDILRQLGDGESNARRGKLFERLIKRYLETDPVYTAQFKRVWLFADWPGHAGQDTGVDLVAQYHDDVNGGGICAIQTKFYRKGRAIPRGDVSTFLTASQDIGAVGRIFVTTSDKLAPADQKLFDTALFQTHVIGTRELANADVSWPDINAPDELASTVRKFEVRPDQRRAIDDCVAGFEEEDRGKLILPCGVGKTFTALKLAEELVGVGGTVLYLVPSIALLAQAMKEWSRQAGVQHRYIGVCSDERAGRQSEDASISELSIPVTTDKHAIARELAIDAPGKMTVVFSTYQSIERISEAQPAGHEFGLIICDEAHRTTGVERTGEKNGASYYVMVHSNDRVRAAKRLYMTATPRMYGDAAKERAIRLGEVSVYSMDDLSMYGTEFHRMTFRQAIDAGLLSDYKVLVLNIRQEAIPADLQVALADQVDKTIPMADAAKLLGCASALFEPTASEKGVDAPPLLRGIAFTTTIKASREIAERWQLVVNEARVPGRGLRASAVARAPRLEADHVDGKMNALVRGQKLDWLRASEDDEHEVRVLSNAKCLSEGVDVPALDAVIFMQPKRSQVDVVQAVGRVMRKAPGKDIGYIILPVFIPEGVDASDALNDNRRYEVVWEVLRALRSHDERLDTEINQIDLNERKTDRIQIVGYGSEEEEDPNTGAITTVIGQLPLGDLLIDHFYARVVEKVGDRQYWSKWAVNVADIAKTLQGRLAAMLPANGAATNGSRAALRQRFDGLLTAMRASTNDALDADGAIAIVAQHMITEPVFRALFPTYDFARYNPVARSLSGFVSELHEFGFDAELEGLQVFYRDVQRTAEGIDNSEGRRKIFEQLYENFFKHALPKEAEKLGVVYTPHELVDFILHSVNDVLQEEFGKSLADPGVHVLDPFAGMGTFIWRLIANEDLIPDEALERKYREELHANEILPLAYYMATVNIEEAFRERMERKRERDRENGDEVTSNDEQLTYERFEGIVWRDTFNAPTDGAARRPTRRAAGRQSRMPFMEENDVRAKRQDATEMTVVVTNPPYRAWQSSASDLNPNVSYPAMRRRIEETYAKRSTATLKSSLHDTYKMAMRWASDRIEGEDSVIGMVSSATFIDGNADKGLRACLPEEFETVYCLNLRGRLVPPTSGDGGSVFPSGTTLPIAVSLLAATGEERTRHGKVQYWSAPDHMTGQAKRDYLDLEKTVVRMDGFRPIQPTKSYEWINVGDPSFDRNVLIARARKPRAECRPAVFRIFRNGVKTNKDAYLYDYSRSKLKARAEALSASYMATAKTRGRDGFTNVPGIIRWDDTLKRHAEGGNDVGGISIIDAIYRPVEPVFLVANPVLISRPGILRSAFFRKEAKTPTLYTQGTGGSGEFSGLMSNDAPDLHLIEGGRAYPRSTFIQSGSDVLTSRAERERERELSRPANSRARARTSPSASQGSGRRRSSQRSSPISSPTSSSSRRASASRAMPTSRSTVAGADVPDGGAPMADRADATSQLAMEGVPLETEDGMCTCGNALPCGVEVEIDGESYVRHDNILDEALDEYRANYADDGITKDDIFYYVYGLLHSPLYVERYQNNLRRELPRIPMAPDFWAFSDAGRRLSELHLNYETCEEYPLEVTMPALGLGQARPAEHLRLTSKKMAFVDGKGKTVRAAAPASEKHTIRVNEFVKVSGIPPEAHEYVVNGRTPLGWMLDRYVVKTDKESGIVHDPNDWFEETGDDIVSKLKRITWLSVETARVIRGLPTPFGDGWEPGGGG